MYSGHVCIYDFAWDQFENTCKKTLFFRPLGGVREDVDVGRADMALLKYEARESYFNTLQKHDVRLQLVLLQGRTRQGRLG